MKISKTTQPINILYYYKGISTELFVLIGLNSCRNESGLGQIQKKIANTNTVISQSANTDTNTNDF